MLSAGLHRHIDGTAEQLAQLLPAPRLLLYSGSEDLPSVNSLACNNTIRRLLLTRLFCTAARYLTYLFPSSPVVFCELSFGDSH